MTDQKNDGFYLMFDGMKNSYRDIKAPTSLARRVSSIAFEDHFEKLVGRHVPHFAYTGAIGAFSFVLAAVVLLSMLSNEDLQPDKSPLEIAENETVMLSSKIDNQDTSLLQDKITIDQDSFELATLTEVGNWLDEQDEQEFEVWGLTELSGLPEMPSMDELLNTDINGGDSAQGPAQNNFKQYVKLQLFDFVKGEVS